jgi:glyoxylase-like metal-dependent hydrolase (beta-lactamase superfamily II)
MRLTHLGHACLLAEAGGARMLFDPGVLSGFDDVRDLDAVLVTHQHPDHLDPARPRVAVPVHEAETTDPAKYAGMLAAFAPDGVVRPLPRARAITP